MKTEDICFFTVGTNFYQHFAPAYIWFGQQSNPGAAFEIIVNNVILFEEEHGEAIEYLRKFGEILIRGIPDIKPRPAMDNTYRFIVEPITKRDFTYIGDIDLLLLEDASLTHHKVFASGRDYSNIVRPGTHKMSGLHFTKTSSQFPLPNVQKLIKKFPNDEELLYAIMDKQNRIVNDVIFDSFRPVLGIHLSLNRLMFSGPDRPGWEINSKNLKLLSQFVDRPSFSDFYELSSENSKIVLKTAIALKELSASLGTTDIPSWVDFVRNI